MNRSSSDPDIDAILRNADSGGTTGQQVDPMLAQLMALMDLDTEKENQNQQNLEQNEEAKDGQVENKDGAKTKTERRAALEGKTNDPRKKLISRSGSDPSFDNVEYIQKIENQTLAMLQAQGVNITAEDLQPAQN